LKSITVGIEQTSSIFDDTESEYMILEDLMNKTGCLVNDNDSTETSNNITSFESDEKESLEKKRRNFTSFMENQLAESHEDNETLINELSNLKSENRKLKKSINNRVLMRDDWFSNRIPKFNIEQMKAICKVGQIIKPERLIKNLRLNNPKTETDQFRTTKKVKERQKVLDDISKQKKKNLAASMIQRTAEALLWFFAMHLAVYSTFGYNITHEQGLACSPALFAKFALSFFILIVFEQIHDNFLIPLLNRIQPMKSDNKSILFTLIGDLLSVSLYCFYIYSHI
jgi:lipopolysaccharide export LptBFGC system permease protein LptF